MIAGVLVFIAVKGGKRNPIKKNQNKTETEQRQESATVSNAIARKMNTPLSLSIQMVERPPDAASVVVYDPIDTSYILCRRLRCCCSCLCDHLSLLTPPSSL